MGGLERGLIVAKRVTTILFAEERVVKARAATIGCKYRARGHLIRCHRALAEDSFRPDDDRMGKLILNRSSFKLCRLLILYLRMKLYN